MAIDIECMHKDIEDIKRSVEFIKNILVEDFELTEEAKKKLELANKTPISEYIDQENVRKRLLK